MRSSAHARDYITARDIARTYVRAGLAVPIELQKTIKRLGVSVSVELDLGLPEHAAYCALCERDVGGPYYYRDQARARLREHRYNLHDVHRPTYDEHHKAGKGAARRKRQRGSFVE